MAQLSKRTNKHFISIDKKLAMSKANQTVARAYFRAGKRLEEAGLYDEAEVSRALSRKYDRISARYARAAKRASE